jgi:hypothetical protein
MPVQKLGSPTPASNTESGTSGVRPRRRFTGHFESEVRAPAATRPTCHSASSGPRIKKWIRLHR